MATDAKFSMNIAPQGYVTADDLTMAIITGQHERSLIDGIRVALIPNTDVFAATARYPMNAGPVEVEAAFADFVKVPHAATDAHKMVMGSL